MRRRTFIQGIAACTAWPFAARAQQPAIPVIGYLNHGSSEANAFLVEAFRKGLSQIGFVEGQNVAIEYRWANFQFDRLPELAADLVRRHVAVIATPVSTPASLAAKAATTTIPIIFGIGTDPVKAGLVPSFNHPGGNITGVVGLNWELGAKRLGLLHELLPSAEHIAVLINPNTPESASFIQELQTTAASAGLQLQILTATNKREIDVAFATLAEKQSKAILIPSDSLFLTRRVQIVGLSLRHDVPALFPWREAAEIGGLMSYGSSFADLYRQVGIYAGRILKGEKPADMPVVQSIKFEFVLNLQTARLLGIEVPPDVLSIADEVIE